MAKQLALGKYSYLRLQQVLDVPICMIDICKEDPGTPYRERNHTGILLSEKILVGPFGYSGPDRGKVVVQYNNAARTYGIDNRVQIMLGQSCGMSTVNAEKPQLSLRGAYQLSFVDFGRIALDDLDPA